MAFLFQALAGCKDKVSRLKAEGLLSGVLVADESLAFFFPFFTSEHDCFHSLRQNFRILVSDITVSGEVVF